MKATAISENAAVVWTPAPGISAAAVPDGAADEVALAAAPATGTTVEEVLSLVELGLVDVELVELGFALAFVETTMEEEPDVPEVVPAGTEVAVEESESGAVVAEAPVPVEVRTASRRLPLLPDATQTPATLLLMS